MEKIKPYENIDQNTPTGWEMEAPQEAPKSEYQQLLEQYDEVANAVFLGNPEDYQDPMDYYEFKYIFEERQSYEMRKLEEKIYEMRINGQAD